MSENIRPEIQESDFVLVQENVVITDKKLESKPTTFLKDAFHRFCKNKSSVVGAFILGILCLLAIIVPVISPYDIDRVSTPEAFLAPKLFEAGTGFWDGTRKYERIVYDQVNGVPALSEKYSVSSVKNSLVSIVYDETPSLIDAANSYASGGTVMFATDSKKAGEDRWMKSVKTAFDAKNGYRLHIVFSDEENVSDSKLAEYQIVLVHNSGEIIIRDYSHDYSELDVDLSDLLRQNGLDSVNGEITFRIKAEDESFTYILLGSCEVSASGNVSNADVLKSISFDDATAMVLVSDKRSDAYWACTGRKGVHNSEIYYCDCVVDTYELVYGDADPVTYTASEIKDFIEKGWCEYDENTGVESFRKLSDECPIDEVIEQQINKRSKNFSSVTAIGKKYHKLGYDEMPRFLLGTDASGIDLVKRAFAGLRASLILGVLTASFCFLFGLFWGSISGYFGGNVDLMMERFCEILSGVPWIVMMTLFILHLGNNFLTFFLALCMTGWMGTAARTRTQFYRFKGREYVLASRTLGSSDMRLIFKHILPNSMGTIITSSVLMIPSVIFEEATLAYLNLGLQGQHSFGVMMSTNQQYLQKYPNLVVFPAIIIALMMISFNLFGNGLRDAFNPSLKGSK